MLCYILASCLTAMVAFGHANENFEAIIIKDSTAECPDPSAFYLDEGELESPGYPENYCGMGTYCSYTLMAKNGQLLQLTFSETKMGYSGSDLDHVDVFEGSTTNNKLGTVDCNSPEGITFKTAKSNRMLLKFYSTNGTVGRWKATFKTISPFVTNVPPTCTKDIFLLIDNSNAMTDDEFNQLKIAIGTTLIYKWLVMQGYFEVQVVVYSDGMYQEFGDFDFDNVYELSAVIINDTQRSANNGPNIARALMMTALNAAERDNPVVTLLISSTSNAEDVLNAKPYAHKLSTDTNTVITFAVGQAQSSVLEELSSGPDFSFFSSSFTFDNATAQRIADALCSAPPTTTETPHPDLPCKPDLVLMFDGSTAATEDRFKQLVNFTGEYLAEYWNIGPQNTEASIITYGESDAIVTGYFEYANIKEFAYDLEFSMFDYTGSAPSIFRGLTGLKDLVASSRPGRRISVMLYTYSSNYDDIAQSVPLMQTIRSTSNANLFVIGMGSEINQQYLLALSGSVFIPSVLDDDFAATLNTALCTDAKPPSGLPTKAAPKGSIEGGKGRIF